MKTLLIPIILLLSSCYSHTNVTEYENKDIKLIYVQSGQNDKYAFGFSVYILNVDSNRILIVNGNKGVSTCQLK